MSTGDYLGLRYWMFILQVHNILKLSKFFLVAAATWSLFSLPGSAMQQASESSSFTAGQEARIGQIAADYLLAHPEILVQVSQELQAQQQEQQVKALTMAALEQKDALINDKSTPSYGPADARVVLIEFFDYQCIVCARQTPVLETIMKANPQVRYVFKEWPIFAPRWESSLSAAKTGLLIWQQKGPDAYLAYHNAIFVSGHNEGKLTQDDISHAAGGVEGKGNEMLDVLSRNDELAQVLGLQGTPGLIIMPASGASVDNVTVIPGGASKETLQSAIDRASNTKS